MASIDKIFKIGKNVLLTLNDGYFKIGDKVLIGGKRYNVIGINTSYGDILIDATDPNMFVENQIVTNY